MNIKFWMLRSILGFILSIASISLMADPPANAGPPADVGSHKVTICHKGQTISVAKPAVSAHLKHGDTLGTCDGEAPEETPETLLLAGLARDFADDHPDFEENISGHHEGCVQETLGENQKPLVNEDNQCEIYQFSDWYSPEHPHKALVLLVLEKDKEQDGVYTYTSNQFFPINKKLLGNQKRKHNYHFTFEVHAEFTYQPGQTFHFYGDDDLWVFIDNKLVIDLGGVHSGIAEAVDLDSLDLVEGQTYPLDLFFAERHTSQSNFMMQTNLKLATDQPALDEYGNPTTDEQGNFIIVDEQGNPTTTLPGTTPILIDDPTLPPDVIDDIGNPGSVIEDEPDDETGTPTTVTPPPNNGGITIIVPSLPTITPDQLGQLMPTVIITFNETQVAQLPPSAIGGLTGYQINILPAQAFAGFLARQLANLQPRVMLDVSPVQIRYLKPQAVRGFKRLHIANLAAEAVAGFRRDHVANLTREAVKGFKLSQFKRLDPEAIAGLHANNLGGLDSEIVHEMGDTILEQVPEQEIVRLPKNDLLQFVLSLNKQRVQPRLVQNFLPQGWKINVETGQLGFTPGVQVQLPSIQLPDMEQVFYPRLPNLKISLQVGGLYPDSNTPTLLDSLNKMMGSLGFEDFGFEQTRGFLQVRSPNRYPGLGLSFIPQAVTQLAEGTAPGISMDSEGRYVLTTEEGLQLVLAAAPKDLAELSNLTAGGRVQINANGETRLELPELGKIAVGNWLPLLEPTTELEPGIHIENEGDKEIIIVVYPDGTMQRLQPRFMADNIAVASLASYSAAHLARLEMKTFMVFTQDHVAALQPEALSGVTAEQTSQLGTDVVIGFSDEQIGNLSPEAIGGFTDAHIANLQPEAAMGLTEEHIAQFSKEMVSGLQPDQFANLSETALTGFNADNVGGLKPEILRGYGGKLLAALQSEVLGQLPETEVLHLVLNLDPQQVNTTDISGFLPGHWTLNQSGSLQLAPGYPLRLPRMRPRSLPVSIQWPEIPDLSINLNIGGAWNNNGGLLGIMNQSLADMNFPQFQFQQQAGVLRLAGLQQFAGAEFAFIPGAIRQATADTPQGLAVNRRGDYTLTLNNGLEVTMVAAPKDPIGLANLVPQGNVMMNEMGEVELQLPTGQPIKGVFSSAIEVTPLGTEPGLYLENDRVLTVVYPDGSAQKMYPAIYNRQSLEELAESAGITEYLFAADGKMYFVADDTVMSIVPTFEMAPGAQSSSNSVSINTLADGRISFIDKQGNYQVFMLQKGGGKVYGSIFLQQDAE